MKDSLYLAQKYARAFDSCAKNIQEAEHNLLCYQTALSKLVQIKDIAENPALPYNQKEPLLKEVLGQDIGAAFVCLLIKTKRFVLAKSIEREIISLLDKRQGIISTQVITATPIDSKEQEQIKQVLSNYFKSPLKASFKEDKNILGGIIVKHEDICIDGSILGKLENLKQTLKR